jgi:rhodanese-related sulfurtransferase
MIRRALAVLAGALGLAAAWTDPLPVASVAIAPIEPLELAEWIRDRKEGLRVIDLRGQGAPEDDRIPSAQPMDLDSLRAAAIAPLDVVVLCASAASETAEGAAVLREAGHRNVLHLRGGVPAWRAEVLFPALPEGASPDEQAAFARASGLSRYFGGTPRKGAPQTMPAPSRPRGC